MISVSVNMKGLKQFHRALNKTEVKVNKVCQQSLNRTLVRTRTQMTRAIGEKLNLKKKTIRGLMTITRATKATGLAGKLTIKGKPVSLIEFKAKQNRKGVSFKPYRNQARKLVKHAFVMPDRRGRATVFRREPGAARLKIKPLYGTSVTDVAKDKLSKVNHFASTFWRKEVGRRLARP